MEQLLVYNRLPLQGAFNVRELGGLPGENNKITKYRSFLRSDGLTHLTQADMDFLKEFGLKTVIDLRSDDELSTMPNPFATDTLVQYHNIPFSPGNIADATRADKVQREDFLAEFYLYLLQEAQDRVKLIFDTIANADQGVILFHCTAGKDRTGVLAMLLLGLAGVANYDIAANYQVTYTYLRQTKFYQELKDHSLPQLLWSKEEFILRAIDYIEKNFGDIPSYLKHCNIDKDTLLSVKQKVI